MPDDPAVALPPHAARILADLREAIARKPQTELQEWREAALAPDMSMREMERLKSLGRFSWRDFPVDAVLDAYRMGYADGRTFAAWDANDAECDMTEADAQRLKPRG